MTHRETLTHDKTVSRRTIIQTLAAGAGAMVAGAGAAAAQPAPVAPPSTITSPPRDFGPRGAPTTYFWDPDVIAVDPADLDPRVYGGHDGPIVGACKVRERRMLWTWAATGIIRRWESMTTPDLADPDLQALLVQQMGEATADRPVVELAKAQDRDLLALLQILDRAP